LIAQASDEVADSASDPSAASYLSALALIDGNGKSAAASAEARWWSDAANHGHKE
jgi:hypothetical protein